VEEKDGAKMLGFEYLKPDTPIKPRDPEDIEPADLDLEQGGGAKVKTKRAAPRRGSGARGQAKRKAGSSPVPKVPLGSR